MGRSLHDMGRSLHDMGRSLHDLDNLRRSRYTFRRGSVCLVFCLKISEQLWAFPEDVGTKSL